MCFSLRQFTIRRTNSKHKILLQLTIHLRLSILLIYPVICTVRVYSSFIQLLEYILHLSSY